MIELHRLMLRDQIRVEHYAKAIAEQVHENDIVVDLGAGTGLLAMLCARAGAAKIHAIEASDVAAWGKKIVARNGFDRQVTWHLRPSYEVNLKKRAHVLVTETFGSHPFEENVHEFVRDARERLLIGDTRLIPRSVSTYLVPICAPLLRADKDLFSFPIAGFDYRLLRPFSLGVMYAELIDPTTLMSEACCLETVELGSSTKSKRQNHCEFVFTRDGTCDGLCQWFELDLGGDVRLSTAPHLPKTHWRQIYYPFDQSVPVRKDEKIAVTLNLDTRLEVGIQVSWQVAIFDRGQTKYRYQSPEAQ